MKKEKDAYCYPFPSKRKKSALWIVCMFSHFNCSHWLFWGHLWCFCYRCSFSLSPSSRLVYAPLPPHSRYEICMRLYVRMCLCMNAIQFIVPIMWTVLKFTEQQTALWNYTNFQIHLTGMAFWRIVAVYEQCKIPWKYTRGKNLNKVKTKRHIQVCLWT